MIRPSRTAATALLAGIAFLFAAALGLAAPRATAQNLFEPVITVDGNAITRYELDQRAKLLSLLRAPANPERLAREQLIEERLKMNAARSAGVTIDDATIREGMENFASQGDVTADQLIEQLDAAGVSEQSFRDFVRAGITWREMVRARFSSRVSVSEEDLDRAQSAVSGRAGVRVLLSEIIIPMQEGQENRIQALAQTLSEITSPKAFSANARQYSASPSRDDGGQLDWLSLNKLPQQLRPVVLGLAPGEVTDPIPIQGALALFQMRAIEEVDAPSPDYAAIEYAIYHLDGGRSPESLERAAEIEANTDTCDDLYGVVGNTSPEVLQRTSKAPSEIPRDVALELARLDPGEISTNLTGGDGRTLMVLMLCGRTEEIQEDPDGAAEDLARRIGNQRLEAFAQSWLEQLRAEARIIEK
ncbi:peptidylprolyl isomerase [Roseovarius sp. TE539]|uniref:peptidylprolyl isomerase n=1 Tax=Roseovarius sp. TE539 TaxID=2249812 RepID=UPI00215CBB3D|nr:peptidylprolyl isomerase [Roseovarius sp. TE539]